MNCGDVRLLLHAYFDDELDAAHSLTVAQHVSECAACAQRLDTLSQMRNGLRSADLYRPAPAQLRERIAAGLPPLATAGRRKRRGWGMALAAMVALFVIAALFAGWQTLRLRQQGGDALVAEAVSDHVRALLPGHLIDVRSTDQHTVKPWFDGRLDFSPQVKDLSARGFELVGGRLDLLGGRQVAVLVYKRHLHVINLFEWPDASKQAASRQSRNGYHVLEWSGAGLRFIAVSSVAEGDLQTFANAFRATPAAPESAK